MSPPTIVAEQSFDGVRQGEERAPSRRLVGRFEQIAAEAEPKLNLLAKAVFLFVHGGSRPAFLQWGKTIRHRGRWHLSDGA